MVKVLPKRAAGACSSRLFTIDCIQGLIDKDSYCCQQAGPSGCLGKEEEDGGYIVRMHLCAHVYIYVVLICVVCMCLRGVGVCMCMVCEWCVNGVCMCMVCAWCVNGV